MGQHVEGERVEQQVERRPLERLAAGAPPGPRVRHLREPVALPLGLGLEPQPSQQILAGNLQPVIRELALRPPALGPAGGRPFGLEQLELAAVAAVAQRRTAARAARPDRRLPRQRVEAGVVELARRSVEAAREAADPVDAPPPSAARPLHAGGGVDLGVVAGARELERAADRGGSAVRVGELLGDHVHHPAQRVGAVQHARRPADHLDALRQPRVDRGTVLVAPRVVFQPAPVLEHQHSGSGEPPDDRLADLLPRGEGVDPREVGEGVGERHALLAAQLAFGERVARERRGARIERSAGRRHGDRLDPHGGALERHVQRGAHTPGDRDVARQRCEPRRTHGHGVTPGGQFGEPEAAVGLRQRDPVQLRDDDHRAGDRPAVAVRDPPRERVAPGEQCCRERDHDERHVPLPSPLSRSVLTASRLPPPLPGR